MTPIPRDPADDRRMFERRAEDADRTAPARWLGVAVIVVGLTGSIFTAGYNWRSVAILEANQEKFVHKDVQEETSSNIKYRLSEISKQIEELRAETRAQRRGER